MNIETAKKMFDYCKKMHIDTLGQLADFKLATDTNETLYNAVETIYNETKNEFWLFLKKSKNSKINIKG